MSVSEGAASTEGKGKNVKKAKVAEKAERESIWPIKTLDVLPAI